MYRPRSPAFRIKTGKRFPRSRRNTGLVPELLGELILSEGLDFARL